MFAPTAVGVETKLDEAENVVLLGAKISSSWRLRSTVTGSRKNDKERERVSSDQSEVIVYKARPIQDIVTFKTIWFIIITLEFIH